MIWQWKYKNITVSKVVSLSGEKKSIKKKSSNHSKTYTHKKRTQVFSAVFLQMCLLNIWSQPMANINTDSSGMCFFQKLRPAAAPDAFQRGEKMKVNKPPPEDHPTWSCRLSPASPLTIASLFYFVWPQPFTLNPTLILFQPDFILFIWVDSFHLMSIPAIQRREPWLTVRKQSCTRLVEAWGKAPGVLNESSTTWQSRTESLVFKAEGLRYTMKEGREGKKRRGTQPKINRVRRARFCTQASGSFES